jgi:hypothetical protein
MQNLDLKMKKIMTSMSVKWGGLLGVRTNVRRKVKE